MMRSISSEGESPVRSAPSGAACGVLRAGPQEVLDVTQPASRPLSLASRDLLERVYPRSRSRAMIPHLCGCGGGPMAVGAGNQTALWTQRRTVAGETPARAAT